MSLILKRNSPIAIAARSEHTKAKSTAHRGLWTISDQVANSLFNLGIGIASARLLPIETFGFFSVLFASYLIFRGVFRALVLEPIAVNYPNHLATEHEPVALGISVWFAVIAGAILCTALVLMNSTIDPGVVLLCTFSIAALLITDVRRMLDMVSGNTASSALLSVSMFILLTLFLLVFHQSISSLKALFSVVIISTCLSLALVGGCKSPIINPTRLYRWVVRHWSFSGPLVLEFLASSGLAAVAIIVVGIIGLQESAAYRGAQMVAAPVHMFFLAISTFIVVEASRSGSTAKVVRIAALLMTIVGVGYLLFLLFTDFLPNIMLGNAAVSAIPVVVPLAAHALISSLSVMCSAVLKVQGNTVRLIRLRMISFIPESIAIAIGFYLGSATYMAMCSVVALLIALPLWVKPLVEAGVVGHRAESKND